MAFDEGLAGRVRDIFVFGRQGVSERKMFGGLAFMVQGHMCCGVLGEQLVVRVGADAHAAALAEPHAREMDFTGRTMRGFVYVDPDGVETDEQLATWVGRGTKYVLSLPPK